RLRVTPRGAHAIARRAALFGLARFRDDGVDIHELRGCKSRRMMRRLAAIAAILGATAGLDVEQPAELHAVRIEMLAMQRLRAEQEIVERQAIDRRRGIAAPWRRRNYG